MHQLFKWQIMSVIIIIIIIDLFVGQIEWEPLHIIEQQEVRKATRLLASQHSKSNPRLHVYVKPKVARSNGASVQK